MCLKMGSIEVQRSFLEGGVSSSNPGMVQIICLEEMLTQSLIKNVLSSIDLLSILSFLENKNWTQPYSTLVNYTRLRMNEHKMS